jgi:hypothetical protein
MIATLLDRMDLKDCLKGLSDPFPAQEGNSATLASLLALDAPGLDSRLGAALSSGSLPASRAASTRSPMSSLSAAELSILSSSHFVGRLSKGGGNPVFLAAGSIGCSPSVVRFFDGLVGGLIGGLQIIGIGATLRPGAPQRRRRPKNSLEKKKSVTFGRSAHISEYWHCFVAPCCCGRGHR